MEARGNKFVDFSVAFSLLIRVVTMTGTRKSTVTPSKYCALTFHAQAEPHVPVLCSLFNFNETAACWLLICSEARCTSIIRKKQNECTCLPRPLKKPLLQWQGSNREPSDPECPTFPLEHFAPTNWKWSDFSMFIYNKTWKASRRPWQWHSGQWLQVMYVPIHI